MAVTTAQKLATRTGLSSPRPQRYARYVKWRDPNWPADVPKAVPKIVSKKRAKSNACPTQAEIWGDWRAKSNRRGTLLGAFAAAGRAIAGGLLDETPKTIQLTPAQELLRALDADRDVRRLVGRIDISGASDASCWATTFQSETGHTLDVFYRHGRDVLADLVPRLDEVIRGQGWVIARSFDRLRRAPKMEAGVWLASFRLSRAAPVKLHKSPCHPKAASSSKTRLASKRVLSSALSQAA